MELFKKEYINELQLAIVKEEFKQQIYPDYSFMSTIFVGGVFLDFSTMPDGRRDVVFRIHDNNINCDYIKQWKQEAPGKYLRSDFKKDVRTMVGETPYSLVTYKSDFMNCNLCVLLRELDSDSLVDMDDEEQTQFLKKFGNIRIANKLYSVIKFYKESDSAGLWSTKPIGGYRNENDAVLNVELNSTEMDDELMQEESMILF